MDQIYAAMLSYKTFLFFHFFFFTFGSHLQGDSIHTKFWWDFKGMDSELIIKMTQKHDNPLSSLEKDVVHTFEWDLLKRPVAIRLPSPVWQLKTYWKALKARLSRRLQNPSLIRVNTTNRYRFNSVNKNPLLRLYPSSVSSITITLQLTSCKYLLVSCHSDVIDRNLCFVVIDTWSVHELCCLVLDKLLHHN